MVQRIAIAEPQVKYPVKMHEGKRGDVGIRLGAALLAGHLRQHARNVLIDILPYRLYAYEGRKRNLRKDLAAYDIVCSGASTNEFPDAYTILSTAKEMGKVTIAGGIFPSANPDYVLGLGGTDFVVRGEGEETFTELVTTLQKGGKVGDVKGISHRTGDRIIHNPARPPIRDIDSIKPAYDLLPMRKYTKLSSGSIYSARGCFMRCNFCTVSRHWNYCYRPRSIPNVIEEIKTLIGYGFRSINFKDESITLDPERTKALLRAIREENLDVAFKAKSRIDDLSEDLMDQMLAANLRTLHFGVESVSQRSLDRMRKGITCEEIRNTLNTALQKGFRLNPVFMLGYAGQTRHDLEADAEFITDFGKNENVMTYLSCLTPHPGSELWTNAREHGLTILTGDLDNYTHKRLVSVPDSLGTPGKALALLCETQKRIVETIGGVEHNPLLDRNALLAENPQLRHITEMSLGNTPSERRRQPEPSPWGRIAGLGAHLSSIDLGSRHASSS